MRYRVAKSAVVVTEPNGSSYRYDIVLGYDQQCKTFIIMPTDGQLKGYQIDAIISELVRCRDHGTEMALMPTVS